MNEKHPDRESYFYICNELIEKEIDSKLERRNMGKICAIK